MPGGGIGDWPGITGLKGGVGVSSPDKCMAGPLTPSGATWGGMIVVGITGGYGASGTSGTGIDIDGPGGIPGPMGANYAHKMSTHSTH